MDVSHFVYFDRLSIERVTKDCSWYDTVKETDSNEGNELAQQRDLLENRFEDILRVSGGKREAEASVFRKYG